MFSPPDLPFKLCVSQSVVPSASWFPLPKSMASPGPLRVESGVSPGPGTSLPCPRIRRPVNITPLVGAISVYLFLRFASNLFA